MMLSNCFCEERVVDDQSCWWLRRRWRKWPEDPALMATSPSEMASSIRRVFPQVSTEWVGGRWGETAPLKPVWHDQASYLTHRSTGHTPPLRRFWPAWVFMFRGVCLCLMPAVPPEIKVILTGRRNGRWLMEGVLGFDLCVSTHHMGSVMRRNRQTWWDSLWIWWVRYDTWELTHMRTKSQSIACHEINAPFTNHTLVSVFLSCLVASFVVLRLFVFLRLLSFCLFDFCLFASVYGITNLLCNQSVNLFQNRMS